MMGLRDVWAPRDVQSSLVRPDLCIEQAEHVLCSAEKQFTDPSGWWSASWEKLKVLANKEFPEQKILHGLFRQEYFWREANDLYEATLNLATGIVTIKGTPRDDTRRDFFCVNDVEVQCDIYNGQIHLDWLDVEKQGVLETLRAMEGDKELAS